MKDIAAIILAAGKGKRMNSNMPKVMHRIGGKPLLGYVLDLVKSLGIKRVCVVTGYKFRQIERYLNNGIDVVRQPKLLGTADAVGQARKLFSNSYSPGEILILYGDVPLLKPETLKNLVDRHRTKNSSCTLLTCKLEKPTGFGRVVRDRKKRIIKVVEEEEASEHQRSFKEANVGAYCFKAKDLFSAIKRVRLSAEKGEYYLTDVISILAKQKRRIESTSTDDNEEVLGVNSRTDLAKAEGIVRKRILDRLMKGGVTILDPHTTYIDQEVQIGRDTIIFPHTIIERDVKIGKNCTLGPFCRIRSGTRLNDGVRVGNFVELNRTKMGRNSKVKHFSYLGDARIGDEVNVGAGAITANFDGRIKSESIIEDGSFIGSGTILIAPVKVGAGAVTGAGCVVPKRKDVPAHSVVIGVPARPLRKQAERTTKKF